MSLLALAFQFIPARRLDLADRAQTGHWALPVSGRRVSRPVVLLRNGPAHCLDVRVRRSQGRVVAMEVGNTRVNSAVGGDESLPSSFARLWAAFAVSEFGAGFSLGAIAALAVRTLNVSAFEVALIFAAASLAGSVVSLPVGTIVEGRQKRPFLVLADVARTLTAAVVPLAMLLDCLSTWLLISASAATAMFTVVFAAANDAHLKDLVPAAARGRAYAKIEATRWTLFATATPLGGIAVSIVGPGFAMTIDAATYLVSAFLIRSITQRETPPRRREATRSLASEVTAGWRYIFRTRPLRSLFLNAMLFGGALRMTAPVIAVLVLRNLNLPPWQYGFILGVPAVGGMIGSRFAPQLQHRYGSMTVLLAFGTLRTVWMVGIALTPAGPLAFPLLIAFDFMLMVCAGVFNPTFATYRTSIVDDRFMARVSAAWPSSAMVVQPAFLLFAAGLVAAFGVRVTLIVASILLLSSSLLLPWARSEP
jgi:MFS family permease